MSDPESAPPVFPSTLKPPTQEEAAFGKLSYKERLGFKKDDKPTTEELKAAHRKQIMKYHPDRGGSQRITQDIGEAYAALKKGDAGEDSELEKEDEGPGDLIMAIVEFTDNAESFEDLEKTFSMHSMVNGDRLRAVDLPKKIDDRILILTMKVAAAAEDEAALQKLRERIGNLSFFTPNAYAPGGTKSYAEQIIDARAKELGQKKPAEPKPTTKDYLERANNLKKYAELESLLAELQGASLSPEDRQKIRTKITYKARDLRKPKKGSK